MGGGYYDRDVTSYSSYNSNSSTPDHARRPSPVSERAFSERGVAECHTLHRTVRSTHKNPIVCITDVTGSMGDWPRIIWDKLPMFYGQILQQGYLEDPDICFAGVGDCNSDMYPFQVCDFARGNDIETWIRKLYIEGGGGGSSAESYETIAYYFARHCEFPNADGKPLLIMTGDEAFYPTVKREKVMNHFGDELAGDLPSEQVFEELKQKFNVFLLRKTYCSTHSEARINALWQSVLGAERVRVIHDPLSIVDVMLGIIAMMEQTRTLETYIDDMVARGQTAERVTSVQSVLEGIGVSNTLPDNPAPTRE